VTLCDKTVARRVLAHLRLPHVQQKPQNIGSPCFGDDLVAHGSSELEPLRRRAPVDHHDGW